jgi:hypothetical protein
VIVGGGFDPGLDHVLAQLPSDIREVLETG